MYNSAAGRAAIGRQAYDFYRCKTCGYLITQPQMVRALGPDGTGSACPNGHMTQSPTNLPWWGWCLPRVWSFAIARAWELGPRGILGNLREDWRRRQAGPDPSDDPTPPPGVRPAA